MTWNYRVVKSVINGEESYAIHEAYYNEDGEPKSITVDSIAAYGDSAEELKLDLERMLEALSKPILNEIDFDPANPIT